MSNVKHNFRQLTIWKDGLTLAKEVYSLTQSLPKEHKYGISSQIFSAAVSISSNIAEGTSRNSQKEFSYYLRTSPGSAFELETQLIIVAQCNLVPGTDLDLINQQNSFYKSKSQPLQILSKIKIPNSWISELCC